MTARRPRAELLPNANNPRLLLRLLALVARGVRSPRALAEVLEVEPRTAHYYTQAAEWLGLLSSEDTTMLTPRGLELISASGEERQKLYAAALWSNPFVQALFATHARLPDAEVLAEFVQRWEPPLSPATARRRASAIQALIEPALRYPPAALPQPPAAQLALPLALPEPLPAPPAAPVDLSAGLEENPDVYARLLCRLLDCGELATGQIRALLDEMGGEECSLGGIIDVAVRRGDVHRLGERLIISQGALRRRELAADGTLVALSDPLYRRYLDLLGPAGDVPEGRAERSRLARHFTFWDLRLFGERLQPELRSSAIDTILRGRRLDGIPVAQPEPVSFSSSEQPFIEDIDNPGLLLAFPQTVRQLADGVGPLNERLRRALHAPAGVRLPSLVDERIASHGGLQHPGEYSLRVLPDNRSLRLRALTHCPAFTLLGALLLLHRRQSLPLRLRLPPDHPAAAAVLLEGHSLGAPLTLLTAFCEAQGWRVSRPPSGGLQDADLLHTATRARFAQLAGDTLTIAEAFFVQLQEDLEARLSYEPLLPLVDRLEAWIEALPEQPPPADA